MNGKFFKYTLALLGVAIIFIIIGGISVTRVDEYKKHIKTDDAQAKEYTDMQRNYERQQVVNILSEQITDEEKIDKIEEIFLGE